MIRWRVCRPGRPLIPRSGPRARSCTLAVGEAPSRSTMPATLLRNLLIAIEACDLLPASLHEGFTMRDSPTSAQGYSCDETRLLSGAERALRDIDAVTPAILALPFVNKAQFAVGGHSRWSQCTRVRSCAAYFHSACAMTAKGRPSSARYASRISDQRSPSLST